MSAAEEAAALFKRQHAHDGCNCVQDFGVTDLDIIDRLVNDQRIEQPDASRILWDYETPIANELAIEHAGAQARAMAWAKLVTAFPWLQAVS